MIKIILNQEKFTQKIMITKFGANKMKRNGTLKKNVLRGQIIK